MQFSRDTRRKLAALRRKVTDRGKTDECGSPLSDEEQPLRPGREEPPASADGADPGMLSGLTRERLKARIGTRREDAEQKTGGPAATVGDAEPENGEASAESARPEFDGPLVAVEELFPGEVRPAPVGECWVMRLDVASACTWGGDVSRTLCEFVHSLDGTTVAPVSAVEGGPELAFLDIETAGLSALPVFLVGILQFRGGSVEIAQILARDLPEEAALLHETARILTGCSAIFTYNGRTFDMPYLRDRAIYHGVDFHPRAEHIDLLPLARKRFKGKFPDCKLQTLESCLCGRERTDDIPGADIPQRYQEFVRSQDGRLLECIIRHNRLDILTLAELLPHCLPCD